MLSFIRKVCRRQQSNGVVENLYVSLVHAQQCQCDFLLETPNNGVLIRLKEIRTRTALRGREGWRVFSPPPLSYELSVESYSPRPRFSSVLRSDRRFPKLKFLFNKRVFFFNFDAKLRRYWIYKVVRFFLCLYIKILGFKQTDFVGQYLWRSQIASSWNY